MTAPHFRRVVGYPVPYFGYSIGLVAAYGTVVQNLPAGPGELLALGAWDYDTTSLPYNSLEIQLYIDAVLVYTGPWRILLGIDMLNAAHGLFACNNIQNAVNLCSSFQCKIPYESTAAVVWYNNNASHIDLITTLISRVGA